MKKPMQKKSLREQALEILTSVIVQGRNVKEVFANATVQQNLTPYLQEICLGTLRFYPQLECILRALVKKPLVDEKQKLEFLLAMAFYELMYTHTAPYAIINETVNAAKKIAPLKFSRFVNGVLRNFQRQEKQLQQKFLNNEVFKYAHPAWLIAALQKAWPSQAPAILQANNGYPPMDLRVNALKISRDAYMKLLQEAGIEAHAYAEYPNAVRLEKPVSVNQLPKFNEGFCSVQDVHAQISAGLLDLKPGFRVLDACAAPGGKTAHLLETESGLKEVVAVEIDPARSETLQANLKRLGLSVTIITRDVTTLSDKQGFDRILCDVPCSATGVMRRHPDIKLLRRAQDIPQFQKQQIRLLEKIWPLLRPDGILVYVTCSIFPEENEVVIERFLNAHPDAAIFPFALAAGAPQVYGWQLFPTPEAGDGFYYARLKKNSS